MNRLTLADDEVKGSDVTVSANPKYSVTLQHLRQQRGVLDQAITALELLNGERPMPEVPHVLVEPVRPQKLLTAARRVKRKYTRRKKTAAAPPAAAAAVSTPAPVAQKAKSSSPGRQQNVDDDNALLHVLGKRGSLKPNEAAQLTQVPLPRLLRAKGRLQSRGEVIVTGWARGARWSLPAAKEAP